MTDDLCGKDHHPANRGKGGQNGAAYGGKGGGQRGHA
jgi:hypothetical protein